MIFINCDSNYCNKVIDYLVDANIKIFEIMLHNKALQESSIQNYCLSNKIDITNHEMLSCLYSLFDNEYILYCLLLDSKYNKEYVLSVINRVKELELFL